MRRSQASYRYTAQRCHNVLTQSLPLPSVARVVHKRPARIAFRVLTKELSQIKVGASRGLSRVSRSENAFPADGKAQGCPSTDPIESRWDKVIPGIPQCLARAATPALALFNRILQILACLPVRMATMLDCGQYCGQCCRRDSSNDARYGCREETTSDHPRPTPPGPDAAAALRGSGSR